MARLDDTVLFSILATVGHVSNALKILEIEKIQPIGIIKNRDFDYCYKHPSRNVDSSSRIYDIPAQLLIPPLHVESLSISKVELVLSVHASIKVYISFDATAIHLDAVAKHGVYSKPAMKIVEEIGTHYAGETILRAGWVVGSLGFLGSPFDIWVE